MTNLPEGIYFNMPASDYFALPYFSRSLAQKVRFSGKEVEYYLKNLTQETPAMALGTAIHSMFLEPKNFAETYVKEISPADFGNKIVLKTADDFKQALKNIGEKQTGLKEELIARARPYLDPEQFIVWDDAKANFDREVEIFGKKVLSDSDFNNLENIRAALGEYQDLPETIKNGRAEVVIIWKDKETGIMCKCRLDYVQPLAITDVKSYSIKDFNTPLAEQLDKKTVWSFYNFQYAIYKEALETVINSINEGKAETHGEPDKEWLAEFLKNPIKQFFILYVRTQAPYQMQAQELRQAESEGAGENAYFSVAQNIWRSSIRKYANFLKTGKWLGETEIRVLLDQNVPNVMWQQSTEE